MKDVKGKKVFVGISGGVDSSVTAALLQKAGADVYGIFIKGWYPAGMPCTWSEDRRDAMRVAAHLGIPFHTLDASLEYKKFVIDYLIREYGAGRTPNPDIMCNKEIKFGVFYDFAKKQGADYIATGHYSQNKEGKIYRGVDSEKDQSYFLWAISPSALAMTLFPLGGFHKEQVRILAQEFALPTAQKKDSQGICFLGEISVADFLKSECQVVDGNAVDEAGALVGVHDGALLYTLGERIALRGTQQGPWYVQAKNLEENTIVVSKERIVSSTTNALAISNQNFFTLPDSNEVITAHYRYHGPVLSGTYADRIFTATTQLPEAIPAGQSLVLYRNAQLLGGGIIC